MEVEFAEKAMRDQLLIIAEDEDERIALSRWDNCVLSAKYNHDSLRDYSTPSLLIVKEV